MTEKFEYQGYWWLPEKPNLHIPGTLKFDPTSGARLELLGTFKARRSLGGSIFNVPIIHGVTDRKRFTLYNCSEAKFGFSAPGLMTSSFIVLMIFEGCYFAKPEDISFDSISVTFNHLDEWVGLPRLKETTKADSKNLLTEYHATFIRPRPTVINVGDFNISIRVDFSTTGDVKQRILKQSASVTIKTKTTQHFEKYFYGILHYIRTFLSLAVGEAVHPLKIVARSKKCRIKLTNGIVVQPDIHIFYRISQKPGKEKILHAYDFLFSLEEIKGWLTRYLKKWIEKSEALSPVYQLYFAVIYSPFMYTQNQFLNLAQALESYHRRTHDGQYIEEECFESVYESLVKQLPQECGKSFRSSATGRLKYLNEYTLRKRLGDIINENKQVLAFPRIKWKVFIDDVANTRNFLTHFNESLRRKAKSGEELHWLVQQMKFVLQVCFMREIGMSINKIKSLITRNENIKYLCSRFN